MVDIQHLDVMIIISGRQKCGQLLGTMYHI
jgi:hypothetical protein